MSSLTTFSPLLRPVGNTVEEHIDQYTEDTSLFKLLTVCIRVVGVGHLPPSEKRIGGCSIDATLHLYVKVDRYSPKSARDLGLTL